MYQCILDPFNVKKKNGEEKVKHFRDKIKVDGSDNEIGQKLVKTSQGQNPS